MDENIFDIIRYLFEKEKMYVRGMEISYEADYVSVSATSNDPNIANTLYKARDNDEKPIALRYLTSVNMTRDVNGRCDIDIQARIPRVALMGKNSREVYEMEFDSAMDKLLSE